MSEKLSSGTINPKQNKQINKQKQKNKLKLLVVEHYLFN